MSGVKAFKGTEAAKRAYMKSYMRNRRANHVRADTHAVIVKASSYDAGRKELRNGSGKMFPDRYFGDNWNPVAIAAEVNAALKRRRKKGVAHG
jgi:hypothetical protein